VAAAFPSVAACFLALLQLGAPVRLAHNLLALCLPYAGSSLSPCGAAAGGGLCRIAHRELEESRTAWRRCALATFCAGSWLLPARPGGASTAVPRFCSAGIEFPYIALTWLSPPVGCSTPGARHGPHSPGSSCSRFPYAPSLRPRCWAAVPICCLATCWSFPAARSCRLTQWRHQGLNLLFRRSPPMTVFQQRFPAPPLSAA